MDVFNYHNLGKQTSYSKIFKYFYVKALRSVNTKTSWCISATLYSKYTAAFTGCPTPECRIWTQLPSQISSTLKETSVPGQSSQDQINPSFPCCFILQITISPATLDTVNESIPSSRYSTVFLNINPWNTQTEASSLTIPPFQLFPTLTRVVLRPVLIISTWPWPRNTLKSILLWQGQWQDGTQKVSMSTPQSVQWHAGGETQGQDLYMLRPQLTPARGVQDWKKQARLCTNSFLKTQQCFKNSKAWKKHWETAE